ncbi:MAG: hypothetical protein AAFR61_20305 [Bacteroidota bacterium]
MDEKTTLAWNLYTELRQELVTSQKLRTQIIGGKITFVSAAIGIIISESEDIPFSTLFVPAYFAVFFDYLIASYSFSIKRIGFYCRKVLEQQMQKGWKKKDRFLLWESFLQRKQAWQNFALIGNLGLSFLALLAALTGGVYDILTFEKTDWALAYYGFLSIIAVLSIALIYLYWRSVRAQHHAQVNFREEEEGLLLKEKEESGSESDTVD